MNDELQKYYENRFVLFATTGWKDLIEDIEARIEAIQSIKTVSNMESLFTRKGELEALEWLKSLPELSSNAYEQLKLDGDIK